MDFHTLSRRELQTLCKKNKIPANATNVAMADALKALEIVEGLEEFLQASQSETAQSTIDSMDGLEVTSPYVPPSGVRSTRRRQAAKQELVTVMSVNRTRQATQKKSVKKVTEPQDCAIEVPALATEDLLQECGEQEKKEVLMTPAPSGATGRRRRVKEVTTAKRVYSTRRSVRLTEKNVMISNEVEHQVSSEIVKKKLPTAIGFLNEEMNLKDDIADCEEISGVTGVDTSTNSLEIPEEHGIEVVSAQKQGVPVSEEIKLGASSEEEKNSHFEAEAPEKMGIPSEEKKNSHFEVDVPEQKMDCGDAANEEVTEQGDQYSQIVGASLNLNHEGSGEGEEEKREHPFEVVGSEQEMKESPGKEAGIDFDTEAELEEKTSDNHPCCESMAIPLSFNNEAGTGSDTEVGMDDAKRDMVEDTSGEINLVAKSNTVEDARGEPNVHDDAEMAFDTEPESFKEESDKIDVPSIESEVVPLKLDDEAAFGIDTEAELGKEGEKTEDLCSDTFMAMNVSNEVQQCSGPNNDCTIKSDAATEDTDGMNNAYNKGFEDNFAVVEFSCNTETKEAMYEEYTDVLPEDVPHLDEALERFTELKLQATKEVSAGGGDTDFIDPSGIPVELNKEEGPHEIGTLGNEENAKPEADLVLQTGEHAKNEAAATQFIAPPTAMHLPASMGTDDELQSPKIRSAQQLIKSMPELNPVSKTFSTMNDSRMSVAVFTDNKENIGSGFKLVVKKQKAKNAAAADAAEKQNENLEELSIRKLTKMLKQKLEINSKDGPGNHNGNKGGSRSALQLLPEDDESHN